MDMSGKNLQAPRRESAALGAMLGVLCGDACGATVEFLVRTTVTSQSLLLTSPLQPQPTDAQVQVRVLTTPEILPA